MDGNLQDESASCESCISEEEKTSGEYATSESRAKFLLKLGELDEDLAKIKRLLYSNLGNIASALCPVQAIYQNLHTFGSSRARLEAFELCTEAMNKKRGNANIRKAWYGCSKHEILEILRHGFEISGKGAYLSPLTKPINCILTTSPDNNGLQYFLLCDVILGNMEEIQPPSDQLCPSVDQFDSGVDNKDDPCQYIIWPENVKTHICPLYVITIKSSFLRGNRLPTSPWIPFSRLFPVLAASLPPENVCFVKRIHRAFMEGRITRHQLVSRVRKIAGDELLQTAIRIFGSKVPFRSQRGWGTRTDK
ncbi:putative inactive poly [ADP-ribose] polymerase SRO5 isoform X2 [Wolffia australiana]